MFQVSAWPVSNHGMQPSASCTRAIAATVRSSRSADRAGGRAGMCIRSVAIEIEHDALAEDGIERAFEHSRSAAPTRHLPCEEAVVEARELRALVLDTEQAAQPPVRRVQRVSV